MQLFSFGSRLPRRIYSLWLQSRASAPAIVRLCFDRWETLNRGWVLTVLDASDVNRLLDGFALRPTHLSAQVLSDVTRIHLLRCHGGLWTDATVLPLKPLSAWMDEGRAARAMAAFEAPAADRPLSSWFLAAPRGSYVMRRWHAEVARYWAQPRRLLRQTDGGVTIPSDPVAAVAPDGPIEDVYPYFWLHYLFAYLVRIDGRFREAWEQAACPISACATEAFLARKRPDRRRDPRRGRKIGGSEARLARDLPSRSASRAPVINVRRSLVSSVSDISQAASLGRHIKTERP